VKCYWAPSAGAPLIPAKITRRSPGPHDVVIKILYAGICHSDIHQARNEWSGYWGNVNFPVVPGHEIAGIVTEVGTEVKNFKVGQRAGVGCMVDSCRSCGSCRSGEEQYCSGGGMVGTYASKFKYPHCVEYNEKGGNVTYGGYSQSIVVDKNYVISIPENLDLSRVAPLLCAGITTYSPLIHYGLRPNHRFAVAGLGGLGHMAVKFGKAFGAHTTVLSRGNSKRESALNELHADAYVDVTNPAEVKEIQGTFDLIINTIAADFDVAAYLNLLTTDGKMVMVGVPSNKQSLYLQPLIEKRRSLSASLIGGIRETQEMIDFCGRYNITSDCELIRADQINEAYERTLKGDVKYRFVIDTETL
jgi:uncharacterized zinc-type alcohol dehydrogenase-like protein